MSTAAALKITPPAQGAKISIKNGKLIVPDNPIIPFIEGDGTGPDIWRASVRVMDAAVQKVYGGKRKIHWMEVYAGEKSNKLFSSWLPDETVAACREYLVSIKGPLTTPIGGGIRSLNVALRQMLDLYVCLRPVRWFKGVPSPVKHPEKVDMAIFRENTEDIYAGIEFELGSEENRKFMELFKQAFPKSYAKIRFPETSGIGIKPVSKQGSERLMRSAVEYAVANQRKSITIVHKGNIQKYTEGSFRNWCYAVAEREFGANVYTWEQWERTKAARGEKDANAEMDAAKKAGAHAAGRVRRHRDAQSQRRLHLRCAGRPGGRHRHRAGREHQLSHRACGVRGHARHRAEVREPGQGESRLRAALRRDDAALHGLDRGGRFDHHRHGPHHRREDRDVRLRAPDGRRQRGVDLGVRGCADPQPVGARPLRRSCRPGAAAGSPRGVF
jgi:hypothetical protein